MKIRVHSQIALECRQIPIAGTGRRRPGLVLRLGDNEVEEADVRAAVEDKATARYFKEIVVGDRIETINPKGLISVYIPAAPEPAPPHAPPKVKVRRVYREDPTTDPTPAESSPSPAPAPVTPADPGEVAPSEPTPVPEPAALEPDQVELAPETPVEPIPDEPPALGAEPAPTPELSAGYAPAPIPSESAADSEEPTAPARPSRRRKG